MTFIMAEAIMSGGRAMWIALPIALFIGLLLFAATYQYFIDPLGLLALGFTFALIDITSLCNEIRIIVNSKKQEVSGKSEAIPLLVTPEEIREKSTDEEKV